MNWPDWKLKVALDDYLRLDKNFENRREIEALAKDGKFEELRVLLLSRVNFGTAGLRGKMGSGFSRLNELVIIQTSQGLAKYLISLYKEKLVESGGIVIGYDARYNSATFANRAATAFLQAKFKVYLFGSVVPTPFVSYAVKYLKTVAGVVITASHNSKEYNGYKVYLKNGAQLVWPHDERVIESIQRNLEPWEYAWDDNMASSAIDPYTEVVDAYFANLKSLVGDCPYIRSTKLSITFSSLHGVSHLFMKRAFEELGFPFFQPVVEQMEPDPEFPTVQYPNPEEGKTVFYCSFKTADENNSTLIVANDPDADRCCVAEKSDPNGSWRIFTGNEMGALLGWWCWFLFKQNNNKKVKPCDFYMISTTVSSKILNSYAKKEGFQFVETLTGFKWIGNKADELIKSGKEVLFAFEEAIGFIVDPKNVKDKDGISASVLMAQMAAYLEQTHGRTLSDQLHLIYKEYGFHTSRNSYFKCHDKAIIEAIFTKMSSPYPNLIGPYRVSRVRDLNKLYDSGTIDHKPDLAYASPVHMITFYLENGIVINIRSSGTEPKLKYYTEAIGAEGDDDWASLSKLLDDVVWNVVNQLLEPEKYKLTGRS